MAKAAKTEKQRGGTRMSAEERRAHILEAALDEFATKGFHGARTSEMARRAGVSETLIYRHFESKEALYEAALRRMFHSHPLDEEVAEAEGQAPTEPFRRVALHALRHTREDPRIIMLHIFQALDKARPPKSDDDADTDTDADVDVERLNGDERDAAVERELARHIERMTARGVFACDDPGLWAKLFMYQVFMCCADRVVGLSESPPRLSDEAMADALVASFVNGVKA